jgi:hypothetical protein
VSDLTTSEDDADIRGLARKRSLSPEVEAHQAALATLARIILAGCLLNEFEAAQIMGLSVKTLRVWRVRKRGCRHIKLENAVRYDPVDIAAFIEAGRCTLP